MHTCGTSSVVRRDVDKIPLRPVPSSSTSFVHCPKHYRPLLRSHAADERSFRGVISSLSRVHICQPLPVQVRTTRLHMHVAISSGVWWQLRLVWRTRWSVILITSSALRCCFIFLLAIDRHFSFTKIAVQIFRFLQQFS